ncbi:MAG: hypothetical protein M3Q50_11700 [Chloroflexota bacterium]|nr:hypothetical protein [Chloroflexota bacterium]
MSALNITAGARRVPFVPYRSGDNRSLLDDIFLTGLQRPLLVDDGLIGWCHPVFVRRRMTAVRVPALWVGTIRIIL